MGSGGFRVCIRCVQVGSVCVSGDIRWVLCEPGWDQVDSV